MSKVNHRHMKAATGANLDATDDQVVRRLIGREAIEFETPAKEAKTSPPTERDDNVEASRGSRPGSVLSPRLRLHT
jgi:hypothetical protein